MGAYRRDLLVEKGYRLDSGNFKALAATNVLTGHEVVTADHIRASFGELGAIALIGALVRQKPSTAKGAYLRSITISSTMGPGIAIDTAAVEAAAKA